MYILYLIIILYLYHWLNQHNESASYHYQWLKVVKFSLTSKNYQLGVKKWLVVLRPLYKSMVPYVVTVNLCRLFMDID